jgi:hypothetical protein
MTSDYCPVCNFVIGELEGHEFRHTFSAKKHGYVMPNDRENAPPYSTVAPPGTYAVGTKQSDKIAAGGVFQIDSTIYALEQHEEIYQSLVDVWLNHINAGYTNKTPEMWVEQARPYFQRWLHRILPDAAAVEVCHVMYRAIELSMVAAEQRRGERIRPDLQIDLAALDQAAEFFELPVFWR